MCWQAHRSASHRVVGRDHFGDCEKFQLCHCIPHRVGARQADGRVCAHDPECLDLTPVYGLKHLHGLEAFCLDKIWRLPEAADEITFSFRKSHMCCQHIGKAADLAPTHGVGLACE